PGLEQTRQPVDEALRRGRCAAVVVVRDARDEHALADLELVAVAQAYRLRNQLAPDERAVGTAEVGEPQATVAALELRVAARGALLADCEGRVRAAPDGADVLRDLEDRAFHRAAGAHDADRL